MPIPVRKALNLIRIDGKYFLPPYLRLWESHTCSDVPTKSKHYQIQRAVYVLLYRLLPPPFLFWLVRLRTQYCPPDRKMYPTLNLHPNPFTVHSNIDDNFPDGLRISSKNHFGDGLRRSMELNLFPFAKI